MRMSLDPAAAPGPIAARYNAARQEDCRILDRARLCAALTLPWLLPEGNHNPNDKLPENYQSVGSRGVGVLAGKLKETVFPTRGTWFIMQPSVKITSDPEVDDQVKQDLTTALYARQVALHALLEQTPAGTRRQAAQFSSAKRASIEQLVVTGDTLEMLTDDYQLRVFGRDQYVTRRDHARNVLYHITYEAIDPLTLTKEQREAAEIDPETLKKSVDERMMLLFTLVEWEPEKKYWKIEQEVHNGIITERTEKITPYFATAYNLAPGEHYGRGIIEANLGDLKSLNELSGARLALFAAASKFLYFIDENSLVQEDDLTAPSGTVLRARVEGGQVLDIAIFRTEKIADYQMLSQGIAELQSRLGEALLLSSETQPVTDRTTATQANIFDRELDAALAGIYADIADQQQIPLMYRLIEQAKRDNIADIRNLPADAMDFKTYTGSAAIAEQQKAVRIVTFARVMAEIGAADTIDPFVLGDILKRAQSIDDPGLVKSRDQVQAERQQAMAEQTQMAGAQAGAQAAAQRMAAQETA